MRLDKWLWCARFFKTRKLAAEAVSGGKVHLNGIHTKPGREVKVGTRLQISKNGLTWDIEVLQLSTQRRPASEAQHFYIESEQSRLKRQELTAQRRAQQHAETVRTNGRPSKRDRRLIHRFKQQNS